LRSFRNPAGRLIPTMTFHRSLLVLRRGPLAGYNRRAVIVTKAVSSLANTTPFAVSSSVQGQWGGMSMSRSMTTMVTWPGDEATMSPARAKLQHVLEEYRQNKYVNAVHNPCSQSCYVLHSSIRAKRSSRFVRVYSHLSPSLSFVYIYYVTSSVSVRRSFLAFSRK
jgi:hypothetical protein